jgi:hypothetical protein
MTATRTRTARKSATLLGIDQAQGDACQDCGRELSARLFRVRVTATGEVRHLGRKCAALATGYPTTRLEHEAAAAERHAAWVATVAATWTVEDMAAHLAEVTILTPAGEFQDYVDGRYVGIPLADAAARALAAVVAEHAANTAA